MRGRDENRGGEWWERFGWWFTSAMAGAVMGDVVVELLKVSELLKSMGL